MTHATPTGAVLLAAPWPAASPAPANRTNGVPDVPPPKAGGQSARSAQRDRAHPARHRQRTSPWREGKPAGWPAPAV